MNKIRLLSMLALITIGLSSATIAESRNEFHINMKDLDFNMNKPAINLENLISEEYKFDDGVHKEEVSKEEESKVIDVAEKMTHIIISEQSIEYKNIDEYFLIKPTIRVGQFDINNLNRNVSEKRKQIIEFMQQWKDNKWICNNIENIYIIHSSKGEHIVKVFLKDISNPDDDSVFDMVLEYDIAREIGGKYKVSKFSYQKVSDIEEYKAKINECELEKYKTGKYLSVMLNSFLPKDIDNTEYSKLTNIDSEMVDKLYEKNVEKTVILSALGKKGKEVGYGYGFFIRPGVVVTTWNVVKQFMKDDVSVKYAVTNDEKIYLIDGVITFSVDLNIAVLKLTEEVGERVSTGNPKKTNSGDPILAIGSPSGITSVAKVGVCAEYIDATIPVIKVNLPLEKGDDGSPLFNMDGEVIGINTIKETENGVVCTSTSFATSIEMIKNIEDKLNDVNFELIEVIGFEELMRGMHYILPENLGITITNQIDESLQREYELLPSIEEFTGFSVYSMYTNKNFISVRYENDIRNNIATKNIITLYGMELKDNGFELKYTDKETEVYVKDNIKVRLYDRFKYLVVILEKI